jgi:hypothetical protein
MSDEELKAQLRYLSRVTSDYDQEYMTAADYAAMPVATKEAADRIEALAEGWAEATQLLQTLSNMNGDLSRDMCKTKLLLAKAAEALREIAAEASVTVHTHNRGGINFKKMYEGWRKVAVQRIDKARATLEEIEGEKT